MDTVNDLEGVAAVEDEEKIDWSKYSKPAHLYEGTDSEDDEMIMSNGRNSSLPATSSSENTQDRKLQQPAGARKEGLAGSGGEFSLRVGQLTAEEESFCPWPAVKKYPYVYVGNSNRQRVAENFFDGGKLYKRRWDFFYIYQSIGEQFQDPILLIPTRQLIAFLEVINQSLGTHLSIPSGSSKDGFQVRFAKDGTPRPRYLGFSTDREMADNMKVSAPPSSYQLEGEERTIDAPCERSLAAFKQKIDLLLKTQKAKKTANKEKRNFERIVKQQSWNHSIKRVQRYLGLRQANSESKSTAFQGGWGESVSKAEDASASISIAFNPESPASFKQELSVVFISIDVEAYERDASKVTEIGVATLDTQDLKSLAPGEIGTNWMEKIRARHFRISEYKHLNNTEFVHGCADKFEFGESEFINLRDAPQVIASCFKSPFSKEGASLAPENTPKRNIVLVGHNVAADVNFLRSIGYDVCNLSNLQELADTADMWSYYTRDINPRNLGSILAQLGIIAWNLHNAGNDATYTLQALIAIAIQDISARQEKDKGAEKERRVAEAAQEAMAAALEKEQGWSSGGENSDGGIPVLPSLPFAKKETTSHKTLAKKVGRPWETEKQSQTSSWGGAQAGSRGQCSADSWDSPSHKPGNRSNDKETDLAADLQKLNVTEERKGAIKW